MKPVLLICLLTLLGTTLTFGQVKIGDNPQNIDPASVLELESSSRVLVITRVSTPEMEAITPQRGGVVYNTDTECMHYYNGTAWINLCNAGSLTLTNDAIENANRTISIVDNGTSINLEVAQNSIRSENIVDGGINGDDIQDNSIGESKLGADSVGRDELRDNTVGSPEIIDGSITPIDIANTAPNQVLVTDSNGTVVWDSADNLRGAVADQLSVTGTGTTADPLRIVDGLLDNAGTDDQSLTLTTANILEIEGGNTVDLNGFLDNTDAQELELDGNIIRISGGNEIALPAGAVNTDNQNLTLAGTTLNISGGVGVDLNPILLAAADGDETIINAGDNIIITGNGTITTPYIINAADAAADGSISNVELTGTDLNFTGTNGGFNGNVSLAGLGGGIADGVITNMELNGTDLIVTGTAPGFSGTIALGTLGGGGGGSTELADQVTIVGDGQTGTEFAVADAGITPIKIQPSATPGQFLSTDTAGNVVWNDLPVAGGVTATDVAFAPYTTLSGPNTQLAIEQLKDELDAATIIGGGENPTNELQDIQLIGTVLSLTTPATTGNSVDLDTNFATDAEVTAAILASQALNLDNDPNNEIELPDDATATAGQILATNADGTYAWVDDQSTVGTIVSTDADQLLAIGTDNGALLTNTDIDVTFATDAEVTAAILASQALDLDNDPNNEIELPDDATATAGQILATNADGTYAWVDDQSTAGTIVSADADQLLAIGTDNGALLTNTDIDVTFATDAELTAAIIASAALDLDIDPNNEIELPDDATATAGQILATNADGTYAWVDDQSTAGTIISGNTGNLITPGTDSGALLTDATLDATFATDAEVTAAILASAALDLDIDPNNELSDIQLTGTTLQLTNPVTGAIGVDLDPTFVTQTELAAFSGTNLGSSNLTQTADRTYDLDENSLTFDITNSSITFLGTNSNMGIGIPNPQDKLDVDGQIRARNGFAANPGSAGEPSYSFYTDSDNDTGMYRIAADEIGFSVGGNLALRIDEPRTGITNVKVEGAFSTNIRTETTPGTITVAENDYTIIIRVASNVVLPTPAASGPGLNVGKIYVIKNLTGSTLTISTFLDSIGASSNTLPIGVTQIQSDGNDWHQIN